MQHINNKLTFKNYINLDPDTWTRSRGWALWKANFELAKMEDKSSKEALQKIKIINDILNESAHT